VICGQAKDIVGIDIGNLYTKIAYKMSESEEHRFIKIPSFISFLGTD
jgi:hypothetical protein